VSALTESLEKLCAELEAMKFESDGHSIKVTDVHEKFADVLTPEASKLLEHDIKSTIGVKEWNEPLPDDPGEWIRRVEYTRAVYLSVTARSPEGMARAGKLIYEEVNKLAAAGLLRGALCRLSALRISDNPGGLDIVETEGGLPATAFFCFPHVPMEVKVEGPYFTEEGGMPVDLEPELKPVVVKRTSLVAQLESLVAEETIAEMERCNPEAPCFIDSCPKCSAG